MLTIVSFLAFLEYQRLPLSDQPLESPFLIGGKRGISPDTSLRLARYFGFTPEYWLNMQAQYELEIIRRQSMRQIEKEIKPREAA